MHDLSKLVNIPSDLAILAMLTTQLLGDTEWRIFVRDPINQASRDARGWKKHMTSTAVATSVATSVQQTTGESDPNKNAESI